jgi:hypothetical protein
MDPEFSPPPETIECPLCLGQGQMTRAEVLERLGMKDFARVAQLSAEEAIRLLLKIENEAEQGRWAKFELELTKRIAHVNERHQAELQQLTTEKKELTIRLAEFERTASTTIDNAKLQERLATERELQAQITALTKRLIELEAAQLVAEEQKKVEVVKVRTELEAALHSEKTKVSDLDRRVKDNLDEITNLREKNTTLEAEMAKATRVGRREEIDFAEEARTWPGVWISEKLRRHGDYLMAYRDPAGNAIDPKIVVDNKDKESMIAEGDIKKLIRDAKERRSPIGILIAREESQLRQLDRDCRWGQEDGVWILRTTRQCLPRDLEVLRPLFVSVRANTWLTD